MWKSIGQNCISSFKCAMKGSQSIQNISAVIGHPDQFNAKRGKGIIRGNTHTQSILGICLHADLRPKQINYQKVDKREIPDFIVHFFGAAPIM